MTATKREARHGQAADLRARSGLTTEQLIYAGGLPGGLWSRAWSPSESFAQIRRDYASLVIVAPGSRRPWSRR